ncbi:MAG: GTPase Era [Desulfatibacillaceae bacterium]|nr:GTPase Era [Desulfatibacillaceae bacterium]
MTESIDQPFFSGFAALVGAPNVGKSTLTNRLLGEKVSIVSRKPQTTRNRILGIVHRPNSQIVLVDTPGVHQAKGLLNRFMVDTALSALADVDIVLFIVDAAKPDPEAESAVTCALEKRSVPVFLVLNKIDLVEKEALLPLMEKWASVRSFDEVIPISAKTGTQVDLLLDLIEKRLPAGPPYFPPDQLTDAPERFLAAEMIREQVFAQTGQEIPYITAVTVEEYKEQQSPPLVRISAVIHVERESQKGILIGKKGAGLKRIGTAARLELEKALDTKVFLSLFVRVEKNWSKDPKAMRRLGYDTAR